MTKTTWNTETGRIEYELKPINDGRASFYNKARVILDTTPDGVKVAKLKSYETIVCELYGTGAGASFRRLWSGYSATTMRHINEFCKQFGIDGGGKKWWESLTVTH